MNKCNCVETELKKQLRTIETLHDLLNGSNSLNIYLTYEERYTHLKKVKSISKNAAWLMLNSESWGITHSLNIVLAAIADLDNRIERTKKELSGLN